MMPVTLLGLDITDQMMAAKTAAFEYSGMILFSILLFLLGYIIGLVLSNVIKRILTINEIERTFVRYGALTSKLWASIVSFIAQYLKWYITVGVLTTMNVDVINYVFFFMGNVLWFILLGVVGLILGGVISKIIKDGLISIGIEDQLKKHKISDAFGGISLSSILGGLCKWYVILVFLSTGIEQLLPQKQLTGDVPMLTYFMRDLMAYIPSAILGTLVILVTLLIARFSSERIRRRNVSIAETMAIGVESIIIFFGVVLALPKFGVDDVSILTESFKILMVGVSLGLAISMGLGLKESFARMGEKIK